MRNRIQAEKLLITIASGLVLLGQNASAAIFYNNAEHILEADTAATDGDGQSFNDDPPAIRVFGTDPVFGDATSASSSVDIASANAAASQSTLFTSTRITASGSFLAEANFTGEIGTSGGAGAIASNSLLVEFFTDGGGIEQRYRLTGNLTHFDAFGGSGGLSFAGTAGGEGVTATNESVDFDLTGILPASGSYVLAVDLSGAADASTPPFGELSQESSGTFDFTLEITPIPVPAAAWLFISALGVAGWLKRGN